MCAAYLVYCTNRAGTNDDYYKRVLLYGSRYTNFFRSEIVRFILIKKNRKLKYYSLKENQTPFSPT